MQSLKICLLSMLVIAIGAANASDLWHVDKNCIYRVTPDGKIIKKVLHHLKSIPTRIASAGDYLWGLDRLRIYKIDPDSGKVLREFEHKMESPAGIDCDGRFLWCIDSRYIYRIDSDNGSITLRVPHHIESPCGIAHDKDTLWSADSRYIYKMDASVFCALMCGAGADNRSVYRIRGALVAHDLKDALTGLTLCDKDLWSVDSHYLYKIEVKSGICSVYPLNPWKMFIFQYSIGGMVLLAGLFLCLRSGDADVKLKIDRLYVAVAVVGLVLYAVVHGVWIWLAINT